MSIILPTAKTPASLVNPKVLVLYGPPKVGKTTVLAQLENCLILDFEDGTDHIDSLHLKVTSLAHLAEVCAEIRNQNRPYKYIAMDTVTSMETWCEELATTNYKNSVIGKNFDGKSVLELPKGAGYLHLRLAFAEVSQMVASVTSHLIQVGHIREKFLEKDTQEASAKDLDLTGKIRNIVCSRADAIGYMYRRPGMNTPLEVSFMTTNEVNCGSRCDHLKGKLFEFDWNKIYLEGKE